MNSPTPPKVQAPPPPSAPSPAPASEGRSEEKEAGNDMTTAEIQALEAARGWLYLTLKKEGCLTTLGDILDELVEAVDTPENFRAAIFPGRDSALSSRKPNSVSAAAHYPGAGVDSARLDWLLATEGSIAQLTREWMRIESPLGNKPYGDPKIEGRKAIDAAMAQSAGRGNRRWITTSDSTETQL